MAATHEKEKDLTREIARKVETRTSGDGGARRRAHEARRVHRVHRRRRGVDHKLCARVTDLLADYRREWDDLGLVAGHRAAAAHAAALPQRRRPPRRASHARASGALRGEVVDAGEREVTVRTQTESVAVPYDEIVRGNLIDEG